MRTVRELMSRDVVTVEEDMSVRDLARLLTEEEITGAPVVDVHGEVVGVVSATDVLQLAASHDGSTSPVTDTIEASYYRFETEIMPDLTVETQALDWSLFDDRIVSEIMNPVRYSIAPDATIEELANLLLDKRIHRALVMEDDELEGIVSTYDVLEDVAGRARVASG